MGRVELARSDIVAIGVLALLLFAVFQIPWSRLAPENGHDNDHAHFNIHGSPPQQPHRSLEWRAETDYSAQSGTLRVQLSHRHGAPTEDLRLRAAFSPDGMRRPVAATWLRNRSGGTYRADNVSLPRGEWMMSLAGRRKSQLVFRLEQSLRVD